MLIMVKNLLVIPFGIVKSGRSGAPFKPIKKAMLFSLFHFLVGLILCFQMQSTSVKMNTANLARSLH